VSIILSIGRSYLKAHVLLNPNRSIIQLN